MADERTYASKIGLAIDRPHKATLIERSNDGSQLCEFARADRHFEREIHEPEEAGLNDGAKRNRWAPCSKPRNPFRLRRSSTGLPMTPTRSDVLRHLADASDAKPDSTTTISSLSSSCEVDEATLRSHLQALADCDLARVYPDGRTRVTITGEELLALDAADPVIVDAGGGGFIGSRTQSATNMENDRG